jgi:sugar/nucleoside kinase (ribokinase family)
MKLQLKNNQNYDLISIGGWAIYDHIFKMKKFPSPGETVELDDNFQLNNIYNGDCVFNVATVAAKMGLKTSVLSVVGNDFDNSKYENSLINMGVDLSHLIKDKRAKSGHNYIYDSVDGDGFCLSWRGASLYQSEHQIKADPIKNSKLVVINEAFDDFTLKGAEIGSKENALIISNGMLGNAKNKLIKKFLKYIDILCITNSELETLKEKIEIENERELLKYGPKILIITLGSKGSKLITSDKEKFVKAIKTKRVIDTTGAGDSFVAGIAIGILNNYNLETSIKIGSIIASFIIQKFGCQTNIPNKDDVLKKLEKEIKNEKNK